MMEKLILKNLLAILFISGTVAFLTAQSNKFEQLGSLLPTPNETRSASGAPGHAYRQNRADYVIDVHLDDGKQYISGKETITYHNLSPDALDYLWLQLDQNNIAPDADSYSTSTGKLDTRVTATAIAKYDHNMNRGYHVEKITTVTGADLPFTINKTMMRVDLPLPIPSGGSYSFKVEWNYNINNRLKEGGRSGYEYFPADSNYLYAIAQFYPRMCVYDDIYGWQNKQFLGSGEFTVPFGDFDVHITVPADHAVAATGKDPVPVRSVAQPGKPSFLIQQF